MPIYAYRCEACGHQQDVLQKMSAAPLTVCTSCGASAFRKQVTAAGFQLKGSGWYVTDFRDKGQGGAAKTDGVKAEGSGTTGTAVAGKSDAGGKSGDAAPASTTPPASSTSSSTSSSASSSTSTTTSGTSGSGGSAATS